ncbi:MAG: acetyltransferase [Mesorhizobium sp.]|uniref:putative colanic acid biosynthesis acetyltransferase n=2 Tax=Mesorhizobium TaxID=68287 RepID=UPI00121F2F51|nr:MAG: acetyltransferase [Mesorhizobium sp.]TIQ12526.1 MAG: acetyltransferase [Mesorhizobium sp.]TIR51734.1 MAG: acetyltransferase [Mesorhizobium sp.]TJV96353.1 MAG: acetyltransferase [Mesorhizobium sp.]
MGKVDPANFASHVAANRASHNWSQKEKLGRFLWALIKPLFFLSPRLLWGWRRFLLRQFGATIGKDVHVYPSVRIAIPWNLVIGDSAAIGDRAVLYALGEIRIGEAATISQGAHLCAGSHDHRNPLMPLTKPPISIGAGAWICADAFIGPGVTIGERAVVGARAVAVRDVGPNLVVVGNPARSIGTR